MDIPALPENLRRLRVERGLGQAELARRAGLSRPGYHQIELGSVEPRSATLEAIARALRVPVADLLRPVAPLRQVRFRSEGPLRTRREIEARISAWLGSYAELEVLLDERKPWALAALADRVRREGPEVVAAQARAELGLGPCESIRDPCGLLEDHGLKVGTMCFATRRFFGLSIGASGGGPAIVVNTWSRITVERWIFTAAHELGHLLLHQADYDPAARNDDPSHERQADAFASAFLMPPDAFVDEWDEARGLPIVDRVMKVKRIFRVSWRTVLHRAARLGDDRAWKLFLDAHRQESGVELARTDEPEALRADDFKPGPADKEPRPLDSTDFCEDRLRRLVRHAVEREVVSLSRAGEILRLPLAEMRRLAAAWTR